MRPSLKRSARRSSLKTIRQVIPFIFLSFRGTVLTASFQVRRAINRGEVVVSQSRGVGTTATPVIRYQFVNAVTGLPATNSVTVTGVRTVTLPFILPAGTFRLRITNIGAGAATVRGAILVF
ncbi:hypothetical protein [Cohnella caldifontis]|uniref:hypothetical protein n=1 Tax=Cohnella caldifontis TaxID=3027471 RepID=UPI0023ECE170|nr:hypothetical protein [Cohnella sp. YIM B05605]